MGECDLIQDIEHKWGKESPFTWNKTLHHPLSVNEMMSFTHFASEMSQSGQTSAWQEIWTSIRKSDNIGLKYCFSKAFEKYEEQFGKVEVGIVPERRFVNE